jgi:hypothetical protein
MRALVTPHVSSGQIITATGVMAPNSPINVNINGNNSNTQNNNSASNSGANISTAAFPFNENISNSSTNNVIAHHSNTNSNNVDGLQSPRQQQRLSNSKQAVKVRSMDTNLKKDLSVDDNYRPSTRVLSTIVNASQPQRPATAAPFIDASAFDSNNFSSSSHSAHVNWSPEQYKVKAVGNSNNNAQSDVINNHNYNIALAAQKPYSKSEKTRADKEKQALEQQKSDHSKQIAQKLVTLLQIYFDGQVNSKFVVDECSRIGVNVGIEQQAMLRDFDATGRGTLRQFLKCFMLPGTSEIPAKLQSQNPHFVKGKFHSSTLDVRNPVTWSGEHVLQSNLQAEPWINEIHKQHLNANYNINNFDNNSNSSNNSADNNYNHDQPDYQQNDSCNDNDYNRSTDGAASGDLSKLSINVGDDNNINYNNSNNTNNNSRIQQQQQQQQRQSISKWAGHEIPSSNSTRTSLPTSNNNSNSNNITQSQSQSQSTGHSMPSKKAAFSHYGNSHLSFSEDGMMPINQDDEFEATGRSHVDAVKYSNHVSKVTSSSSVQWFAHPLHDDANNCNNNRGNGNMTSRPSSSSTSQQQQQQQSQTKPLYLDSYLTEQGYKVDDANVGDGLHQVQRRKLHSNHKELKAAPWEQPMQQSQPSLRIVPRVVREKPF